MRWCVLIQNIHDHVSRWVLETAGANNSTRGRGGLGALSRERFKSVIPILPFSVSAANSQRDKLCEYAPLDTRAFALPFHFLCSAKARISMAETTALAEGVNAAATLQA